MENRSLSVVAGLIALLALPFAVQAADSEVNSAQEAAWQARLDKSAALLAESKGKLAEADKLLDEKNAVCTQKFLVNDCKNAAHREYLKTLSEVRRQENEGKAIERAVKKEQMADRDKRRAEDAPRREAGLQLRQSETAAAHRATDEKMAATKAAKAQKAVVGEQRKAAEAEKHRKRQADHDARVAKKMKEAEQRAAQAAAKAAAKANPK